MFAKVLLVKECLVNIQCESIRSDILCLLKLSRAVMIMCDLYSDGRCLQMIWICRWNTGLFFRGTKNTLINQDVDFYFALLSACVCLVIDTMWYIQLFGVMSPLSWTISVVESPSCSSYGSSSGSGSDDGWLLLCSRVADSQTKPEQRTISPPLLRRQGEDFILKFWSSVVLRGEFNAPLRLFDSRGWTQRRTRLQWQL